MITVFNEIGAGVLILGGRHDLIGVVRSHGGVGQAVDGQNGAGDLGHLGGLIGAQRLLEPAQAQGQGIAPVEGELHRALLLGSLISSVVVLKEIGPTQTHGARPGDHGLEGVGIRGGGQQSVGAALAPAHDGQIVQLQLCGQVVRGRLGVNVGRGIAVVAVGRGGVAVAHKVDAQGGEALECHQGGGCGIAVARLVLVGAGAVEHDHRGVSALVRHR